MNERSVNSPYASSTITGPSCSLTTRSTAFVSKVLAVGLLGVHSMMSFPLALRRASGSSWKPSERSTVTKRPPLILTKKPCREYDGYGATTVSPASMKVLNMISSTSSEPLPTTKLSALRPYAWASASRSSSEYGLGY